MTGLIVLFVALAPASSTPLPLAARSLFWTLHIGIGLLLATAAAKCLLDYTSIPKDWRLIACSAILAVILFAPVALMIEGLFPALIGDDDDDLLDAWANSGWWQAVIVEAIEVAPVFLTAWVLINMEGLPFVTSTTATTTQESSVSNLPFVIPAAIGSDLVAISSDLHYLHIYTRQGKAMLLGALSDVETSMGDVGFRTHRSHWVMLREIKKLKRVGNQWVVIMRTGLEIPLSRRKRQALVALLGKDFEVS